MGVGEPLTMIPDSSVGEGASQSTAAVLKLKQVPGSPWEVLKNNDSRTSSCRFCTSRLASHDI